MEDVDLMKQLTARAIAHGVDEARAAKVAAELAPLLTRILSVDEETLPSVEPATVFHAVRPL